MELICYKCGKPLTKSNKYGMFCENLCDLNESKEAEKILSPLINAMGKFLEKNNSPERRKEN